MGFWAMFMGFLYNDYTGLSLDLFGTCYTLEGET
jgi:vacuolar-type H+-ATPase subunit I/STV1